MNLRSLLKAVLPKVLVNILKKPALYGFFGNYISWQEAKDASTGYDTEIIFEKIKQAALQVKNGNVAYERDTVVFDKPQYNELVLSNLLSRTKIDGRLSVFDFGGSFGNVYFQHKKPLEKVNDLSWNVVEQKHIVEFGKKEFENETLSFFEDSNIDQIMEIKKPNVVLFGSSIQYIEKPYEILEKIARKSIKSIIIDRTPFLKGEKNRIAVQKVSPRIYDASYPAWLLDENLLKNFFENHSYKLITETQSGSMNLDGKNQIPLKSFIFEKHE